MRSARLPFLEYVDLEQPVVGAPGPAAGNGTSRNRPEGRKPPEQLVSLHGETTPIPPGPVRPGRCSVREKVDAAELRPL